MNELLKFAERDFEAGNELVKVDKEKYLNLSCCLVTQAVQNLLCCILEDAGVEVPKNRSIRKLHKKCLTSLGIEFVELYAIEVQMDNWELDSSFEVTIADFNFTKKVYELIYAHVVKDYAEFGVESYLREQLKEWYSYIPASVLSKCETKEDCDKLIDRMKVLSIAN